METEPRISLVEGLLMGFIAASADLFEFIATFCLGAPIIGLVLVPIKWLVAGSSWLIIQFWLIIKGIKGTWFLSGSLLDGAANLLGLDIPFGKTASLLTTIYLINHPKTAEIAQIVAGAVAEQTPETEATTEKTEKPESESASSPKNNETPQKTRQDS